MWTDLSQLCGLNLIIQSNWKKVTESGTKLLTQSRVMISKERLLFMVQHKFMAFGFISGPENVLRNNHSTVNNTSTL